MIMESRKISDIQSIKIWFKPTKRFAWWNAWTTQVKKQK